MLLVSNTSGCGGANGTNADSLYKEQMAAMNDCAIILESVKDDASADEAIPKLEKAHGRMREARDKLHALNLPEEHQKKLLEANKKETDEAAMRMTNGWRQVRERSPASFAKIWGTFKKMEDTKKTK